MCVLQGAEAEPPWEIALGVRGLCHIVYVIELLCFVQTLSVGQCFCKTEVWCPSHCLADYPGQPQQAIGWHERVVSWLSSLRPLSYKNQYVHCLSFPKPASTWDQLYHNTSTGHISRIRTLLALLVSLISTPHYFWFVLTSVLINYSLSDSFPVPIPKPVCDRGFYVFPVIWKISWKWVRKNDQNIYLYIISKYLYIIFKKTFTVFSIFFIC